MSCAVSRDDLWEWLHGDPDDAEARRIADHVASCGTCAESVAGMRSLLGDLHDLPAAAPPAPPLPDAIGDYRIIRKIGEGAMGLVFEAEQRTPRRRVALKVVRGGVVDDFRARLFRREMQTLARLNHPSIAAIYDAGVTPDGQTYFAMELVSGIPLSAYVNGEHPGGSRPPLPLRARIELFHRICAALNYAHQRGVIHRDLKPANILIDDDGNPKVLDFGLARASESEGPEASMVSEAGRLLGTPAYMSPEQTRAEPDAIDVRSDVYTLGVILYELVTGTFPYDVMKPTLLDVVREICETSPRPAHALASQVPLDVSTIAGKALEKDPARRYQTVAELEDDVHRYLNRYPIQARPPSLAYRVSRYVSRHKLPVALLSTIFVGALAAAVVFGVLYDRAQREADKFERINEILTGMMQSSDVWEQGDKDTKVTDVLDRIASEIQRELGDRPRVAAALQYTLGRTYWRLGRQEQAADQLRSAYEMNLRELGGGHLDTVRALNDLGEVTVERGDLEAAEPLLREALQRRRERLPQGHPLIGETLNSLGVVRKMRGALDEAEQLYREALPIRQAAADATVARGARRKDQADAHDALAQTRNNLGALYRTRAGQTDDPDLRRELLERAEGHYQAALQLRLAWLGRAHPEVAKMHNNYGKLLVSLGRLDEAGPHLRDALDILEEGLGRQHQYTARAMYNLADLLARGPDGRGEAESLCVAALAVQQKLLEPDHAHTADSRALLATLRDTPGGSP